MARGSGGIGSDQTGDRPGRPAWQLCTDRQCPRAAHLGDLLGRIFETFVLAQLHPLLDTAARRIRAHHLRQQDGRSEVDILLEAADGHLVGIEIKASASPTTGDARHLAWLRDQLPERFTAGIVLHTGRATYPIDHDITAIPIAALWG